MALSRAARCTSSAYRIHLGGRDDPRAARRCCRPSPGAALGTKLNLGAQLRPCATLALNSADSNLCTWPGRSTKIGTTTRYNRVRSGPPLRRPRAWNPKHPTPSGWGIALSPSNTTAS